MNKEDVLKILEEMPTGLSMKLKIGENDYALKMCKKSQPELTMQDLKEHNIEARGWEQGFAAAIEKLKDWRNEQYLKIKNLN